MTFGVSQVLNSLLPLVLLLYSSELGLPQLVDLLRVDSQRLRSDLVL